MHAPVLPRRQPRQDRSRFTVEVMLDAATRVFDEGGYEAATTNLVAERAGVSVGSLYQYFPSKDALLTALHERHIEQVRTATMAILAQMRGAPPLPTFQRLAARLIELHRAHPTLQRLLHGERPWLERAPHDSAAAHQLRNAIVEWLQASGTPMARTDAATAGLAAVVLMRQAEALVHAAVLEPWSTTDEASAKAIGDALAGYVLLAR